MNYLDVALPLALPGPLTYSIPDDLAARAVPGARVVVPVRGREMVGIVTALDRPAPAAAARPVLAAPDGSPLLGADLLTLAGWIAGHYAASPGLVLRSMLPAALFSESVPVVRRTGDLPAAAGAADDVLRLLAGARGAAGVKLSRIREAAGTTGLRLLHRLADEGIVEFVTLPPRTRTPERTGRVFTLADPVLTLLERDERFKRSPRQRETYDTIESRGVAASAEQLQQAGISAAALRALIAAGLVRQGAERRDRDPFAAFSASAPPGEPTAQQRAALAVLDALGPGEVGLLFGVTGSGKTLVYLEYLRRLVDAGESAIVLVPEIGLTPQTVARFRGVFGDRVAVLHSGLSDGERYDAWRALQSGRKRVAVGARSAVFAAVPRLGAIVVDEEHDGSYKQAEPAPRSRCTGSPHSRQASAGRWR